MSTPHKATIQWQEPPTVEAVRAAKIEQVKREACRLLSPSDWYMARRFEQIEISGITPDPIPQAVLDYRAAVRAASDQAEADVAALSTVEEINAYTPVWPDPPEE